MEKKRKPVRKNTWLRKFRAWSLRLDRLQQQREIVPDTVDETERTCTNCSHVYTGRVCPQCGQVGSWSRYTWRQAFMNFLDIWGLGNRPMFRTLRELFWRPGYMARDYLNGHRQFYFPPFKLLALVVVFTVFLGWIFDVEVRSLFDGVAVAHTGHLTGFSLTFAQACTGIARVLSKNLLYEWLFLGLFIVLCIWLGFRRVSKYNLVETYIFLVFILVQYLLVNIIFTLGNGIYHFVEVHSEFKIGNLFTITNYPILGFFDAISSRVKDTLLFFFCGLVIMDFHQFYGLKWTSTIYRMFNSVIAMMALALTILLTTVFILFFKDENLRFGFIILVGIVSILTSTFTIAKKYLKKNKNQVAKSVIWISRISMLSVVWGLGLSTAIELNILVVIAITMLYCGLVTFLSLLPVALYKRYHNIWIAVLPAAFVLIMSIALPCIFK